MGGSQSPCSSLQQPGSPEVTPGAEAEGRSTRDREGRVTSGRGTGRDGSSSGIVRSTWLQFLQQQYSQVEAWGLLRVTVLGCVRRWVVCGCSRPRPAAGLELLQVLAAGAGCWDRSSNSHV
jgi:hypothetical protein